MPHTLESAIHMLIFYCQVHIVFVSYRFRPVIVYYDIHGEQHSFKII